MRLALCWSRLRLPRAHRVLRSMGVWDNRQWQGEPARICRGCYHGYRMRLEMSDYHQRGAYFYSGLLDASVDLCILHALGAGDTFIDIGANIGMMTMLAARAVGPRGRIIAFEPNPDVYERLLWHISENRLGQVRPHQLALSDHDATMQLSVPPTGNTGAATLGALPARHQGRIGATYEVPVRIGDEVMGGESLPDAPLFIKIDVEGHEVAALRGLRGTIERHRPAILLESNVEMLPQNGTSVNELFALLVDVGYEPFALRITWSRLMRRWQLQLHPMGAAWRPARTENVLFLHPAEVHARRLSRFIAQSSA
jgi:FkbM family methyltransferase